MDLELDAVELRVLGCLIEKEIATPDYYPLTLNALVNACNQKSNRDPVVDYGEDAVEAALSGLREKGLALRVTARESRTPKHEERFTEKFNLGRREVALLCVLMLRGPQTPGELRGRAERLFEFDGLEAVENTLARLDEMGFVRKLPRRPGFKEARYAHLLAGDVGETIESAPLSEAAPSDKARIQALESALAELRREFDDFKRSFE